MASRPWKTNASARVDEFLNRRVLEEADVDAIHAAIRRLEIDPFDILANKDLVGEWHHRIGPSVTVPGSTLAMTYRIDQDYYYVNIISFEVYPDRER